MSKKSRQMQPEKAWTSDEIIALRKEHRPTRRKLAGMLGTTVPTIYRWENGHNRPYKPFLILLSKIEQELIEAAIGGKK